MPSLRVKLFQDGADLDSMIAARDRGLVSGYTTNPTLMRKAGISDYKEFARKVIAAIPDKPISFEVFSDDFATMEREAREIASWGGDTYIKIPITNTKSESAAPLISRLSKEGFSLNVTAIRGACHFNVECRVANHDCIFGFCTGLAQRLNYHSRIWFGRRFVGGLDRAKMSLPSEPLQRRHNGMGSVPGGDPETDIPSFGQRSQQLVRTVERHFRISRVGAKQR
jgi:hypothetical protein